MTRYLLDTTCLIALARRASAAERVLRELAEASHSLGACGITVGELYSGMRHGAQPDVDDFVAGLRYWPITFGDAVRAGQYRYEYRRRGAQLTMTDTLIAAVARRAGATILTENLKDFPMDDVRVANLASL